MKHENGYSKLMTYRKLSDDDYSIYLSKKLKAREINSNLKRNDSKIVRLLLGDYDLPTYSDLLLDEVIPK